ncbi:peptidoglycan-binding protein LysM [Azospirillum doebereinerae]|uniref:peptidoglycan-binding protein LysM n=1 Tax=Azospirillum doebereinerae TaxID=92933 RepID=UPI001EE54D1B|nr:peptidoglycan-binding protein LysM [Azospirillum doebereinerae]MCG5238304.1 peptidoglycan-binding protein LysM [Azospirillum doebereinerae]
MFDFFRRDAGKKLGGNETPDAEHIKAEVGRLGLDVQGLDVAVNGDTVTVKGQAASQEAKEKAVLVAGNVHGVSKVEEQITVAQAQPESQFYTVQSGDTLSKVAKQFYHDANKYPAIFDANRPMLKDPDEIYPGQVLRIPPAA